MSEYKKGDLVRYRDKYWFVEEDGFSYGILLTKDFIFESKPPDFAEKRINKYVVYDFSICGRALISDDTYDIEKVPQKMNKK